MQTPSVILCRNTSQVCERPTPRRVWVCVWRPRHCRRRPPGARRGAGGIASTSSAPGRLAVDSARPSAPRCRRPAVGCGRPRVEGSPPSTRVRRPACRAPRRGGSRSGSWGGSDAGAPSRCAGLACAARPRGEDHHRCLTRSRSPMPPVTARRPGAAHDVSAAPTYAYQRTCTVSK